MRLMPGIFGNVGRPAPVPMKTASKPSSVNSSSTVKVWPMTWFDLDLDAEVLEPVDLALDDRLRQAELRDAVDEHAAGLVQRLEDRHAVAHLGEVGRDGEAGRAGADHRHLVARRRRGRRVVGELREGRVVGHEALEPADRHRIVLDAQRALHLALLFLRADAAADRRQHVALQQGVERAFEIALGHLLDELPDVDLDRAPRHARLVLALDAPLRLEDRRLDRVAERHFLEVVGPLVRVLQRHRVLRLLDDLLRHMCSRSESRSAASVVWARHACCSL